MTIDEAIKRLRELNEPVPTPARLPTAAEVDAVEAELGVQFHPDYRRFLLEASDVTLGALEPATVADPEAHTHLPSIADDAWESYEMPKRLLPICEDNGDFYAMNKKGEVVFWSGDGTTDEKWPNLATWIEEVWIGESDDDASDEDDEEDDDEEDDD